MRYNLQGMYRSSNLTAATTGQDNEAGRVVCATTETKGDIQAAKEMRVFRKRAEKRLAEQSGG